MSATLQAYFDGSGKSSDPQCRFLTLAGYIASPKTWDALEGRWKETLDQWGVPYLHMKELRARKGRFASFGPREAQRMLADFQNICFSSRWEEPHDLTSAVCSVDLAAYERARRDFPRLREKEPESICVDYVATIGLGLLPQDQNSPTGKSGSLEVVFDQGEDFLHKVNRVWERRRRCGVFKLIRDIRSADMRQTPGLQAADYLAWHWNRSQRDFDLGAKARAVFSAPGYHRHYDYDALRARFGLEATEVNSESTDREV